MLNIARHEDGTMTWDHIAMVHEMETEYEAHRKSWDVDVSTGEITQIDPSRVTLRGKHNSVESESTESDEEHITGYNSGVENQIKILESIKQECLSEEDATETFMEAHLNDRHHEDRGYTMAEDKKGNAEGVKEILQDCLRILEVEDTDEEETQGGEEHKLRSESDLGEGGEIHQTKHT